MRDPKGQQFELQFHTKESFQLKTQNHPLYEEFRNPQTPEARKRELTEMQIKEANKIPLPDGVDEIPEMLKDFVKRGRKQ